ncbi:GGDEF domain-containing protein [Kineococcus rhizosphaerae]|uniref:Diguanylate cyclase (GGDEF)-like protein n=1 Tax=Kineococcus rhizosphaerae TaxID=559628 RepID=A0A2T0RAV3_9ACTN|nr:GGDEF domain-containing protein [Kineococcus rhizosphaerae]PRY18270.1 diguanylate cyclase (GGDEF)-like protein [Kineococcus rhizosphaerae]
MSAPRGQQSFVPLGERIRWTIVLRLLIVATGAVLWWAVGADGPVTGRLLLTTACVHLGVTSLLSATARAGRRVARAGLDLGLLLDSAALTLALPALGAAGFALFAVHATAVTLVTSFRTGVKVAGTHTVLVLCLLEAGATGVLPLGPALGTSPRDFTVFASVLWAATLGTATFAAVNERELRRRRLDAEALHRLLGALVAVDTVAAVSDLLTSFAVEELPARRARLVLTASTDRTLREATAAAGPLLRKRLDPAADPWLSGLWPHARGVAVVPLPAGTVQGWFVVDFGRDRGLERRVLRALEQAVAHAALALARAGAVEELRRAATLDGLTGVANRRTLDLALARAAHDDAPWSFALVDLDHFKAVNDTLGHQAGDDVLRSAAAALVAAARAEDLVARYGGEEFAVLMPRTDAAQARAAAERLRSAVSSGTSPRVTCSVGVGTAGPGGDVADLLGAVDRALYAAKGAGRDRCVSAPG